MFSNFLGEEHGIILLISVLDHLKRSRFPENRSINWRIDQVRLICGHVCVMLSWWLIHGSGSWPLWVASYIGKWAWAAYENQLSTRLCQQAKCLHSYWYKFTLGFPPWLLSTINSSVFQLLLIILTFYRDRIKLEYHLNLGSCVSVVCFCVKAVTENGQMWGWGSWRGDSLQVSQSFCCVLAPHDFWVEVRSQVCFRGMLSGTVNL